MSKGQGACPLPCSNILFPQVFPYRTSLQLTATFLANHKIAADSSKHFGECTIYVIWQIQTVNWKISA
jgi:hypothetical protein